jgi:DNA end-binding protein Ku
LVTIPVRLYTAVRRQDVRFREIDRVTGRRVRHLRVRDLDLNASSPLVGEVAPEAPEGPAVWSPAIEPLRRPLGDTSPSSGEEAMPINRSDLVRGYEVEPGRYVEITDEDLEEVAPERSKAMDVEQFVTRKELDPIYFDSAYYVVPDLDKMRPFGLLLRAMQQTNQAAICWLVLRSKRHLAALQPRGNLMLLTTLLFADEVVSTEGLERPLPDDLSEREVDMAELLVKTLSGPFEPERYKDERRERLLAIIESRAGEARRIESELPEPVTNIEDLMEALRASIDAAKEKKQERRRKRA